MTDKPDGEVAPRPPNRERRRHVRRPARTTSSTATSWPTSARPPTGALRHPRHGGQAASADVRRPGLSHRVGLALSAGRAIASGARPKTVLGTRHAKKPIELDIPDHHRRHELRRALGERQGSHRPGGDGGRHLDHDRRRRHDARGAAVVEDAGLPVPALALRLQPGRPAARPTRSRSSSARGPSPAAAACCSGRRSARASPRCGRCPRASTSARPAAIPTGPAPTI